MLEIHPKFELGTDFVESNRLEKFKRRQKTSKYQSSDAFVENLFELKRNLLLKSENASRGTIGGRKSLSEDQLKMIMSMLPDEIIRNTGDSELRRFEAAVLFADISGFTDLSDKFQNFENAASKLSMVLNCYLGTMVQEILSRGGDIIKYAGDAFIAIFRSEDELIFQEAIHRAIDSALIIQKSCSNYKTEIGGVTLNVKIAISGGEVCFSVIGDENSSHYAIVGDPVWQVKTLQDGIKAGEVLVSSIAWVHVQDSLYLHSHNKELRCYKVTGYKDESQGALHQQEALMNFQEMRKKIEDYSSASITFKDPSQLEPFATGLERNVQSYSLRPNTNLSLENKSKKFLRRFIIEPVLKAIDLNEKIECLSEMRHVVIVFLNFVVEKTSCKQLIGVVNSVYTELCGIVADHEGIVNKVSLFDKDMMFLVIFGLRGMKHDLESRIGLRCASEVVETFEAWPNVTTVSAGVTSGMTYCGVVGHSLRREYSAISVTVNKAARLMMAYPDLVSCDQDTLLNSRMELKHFTILPKKVLKGLHDEIFVYKFKEIAKDLETMKPSKHYFPVLSRDEVLTLHRNLMAIEMENFRDPKNDGTEQRVSCLLIKGETQSGKTRILDEIFANCLTGKIRCMRFSLSKKSSREPFLILSKILKKLLKIEKSSTVEAQAIITKEFKYSNADLSLLNTILDLNFPQVEKIPTTPEDDVNTRKEILLELLKESVKCFWVVLIDDIEYMDENSFELLEVLFSLSSLFGIFTLGQQRNLNEEQRELIRDIRVVHHRLKPITLMNQNQLLCQHLNVSAISLELEKLLHRNSNGNPGWIETISKSLLQSKRIEIKSMTEEEAYESGFIINEPATSRTTEVHHFFDQCYREKTFDHHTAGKIIQVAICHMTKAQIESLVSATPENDLMVYDALSSYDQLVCKCASVIGVEFKRKMLSHVLSSSTDRMIGRAMCKLFELQIFFCASRIDGEQTTDAKQKKTSDLIVCNCQNVKVFDSCRDLPRYSCCESIRFRSQSFCSVVYNTLTDKQRVEYHKKSLIYLHMETRRCDSCENGFFPELTLENFNFEFKDGILEEEDNSLEAMKEHFKTINLPIFKPTKKSFFDIIFMREKEPEIQPVILNYMSYDFRLCNCNSILYSMYNDSIRHCHAVGNILKLVDTKIELANMCIKTANVPRAMNLLRKVLMQLKNNQFDEATLFPTYLRAKAFMLQGLCLSEMLQTEEALEVLYKTCKILKVDFPKAFNFKAKLDLYNAISSIKSSVKLSKIGNVSKLDFLVITLLSRTLNLMYHIFFNENNFQLSKLAAFMALENALKVKSSFSAIACSFANVFRVVFYIGEVDEFLWLQEAALVRIARTLFSEELTLDGLTSLTDMYKGIMVWQVAQKNIRLAIKVGEITKNLCSRVQTTVLQTEIVPKLFLLLMNMKRIQDTNSLLQRFETAMRHMKDKNGLIWYYALCMDVNLDTCFTIVSYEDCCKYYKQEMTTFYQDGTPEARSRFFANLYLWTVRHGIREMAEVWFGHLKQCYLIDANSSLNRFYTGIRVFEAMTIEMVYATDVRNVTKFIYFNDELEALIKTMRLALKVCNCFIERFELHELHFNLVKSFPNDGMKDFKRLERNAVENLNFLSLDIIKHTRRSWTCELAPADQNFWINHSTKAKAMYLDGVAFSDRIFPYSLPIPKSGSF